MDRDQQVFLHRIVVHLDLGPAFRLKHGFAALGPNQNLRVFGAEGFAGGEAPLQGELAGIGPGEVGLEAAEPELEHELQDAVPVRILEGEGLGRGEDRRVDDDAVDLGQPHGDAADGVGVVPGRELQVGGDELPLAGDVEHGGVEADLRGELDRGPIVGPEHRLSVHQMEHHLVAGVGQAGEDQLEFLDAAQPGGVHQGQEVQGVDVVRRRFFRRRFLVAAVAPAVFAAALAVFVLLAFVASPISLVFSVPAAGVPFVVSFILPFGVPPGFYVFDVPAPEPFEPLAVPRALDPGGVVARVVVVLEAGPAEIFEGLLQGVVVVGDAGPVQELFELGVERPVLFELEGHGGVLELQVGRRGLHGEGEAVGAAFQFGGDHAVPGLRGVVQARDRVDDPAGGAPGRVHRPGHAV